MGWIWVGRGGGRRSILILGVYVMYLTLHAPAQEKAREDKKVWSVVEGGGSGEEKWGSEEEGGGEEGSGEAEGEKEKDKGEEGERIEEKKDGNEEVVEAGLGTKRKRAEENDTEDSDEDAEDDDREYDDEYELGVLTLLHKEAGISASETYPEKSLDKIERLAKNSRTLTKTTPFSRVSKHPITSSYFMCFLDCGGLTCSMKLIIGRYIRRERRLLWASYRGSCRCKCRLGG